MVQLHQLSLGDRFDDMLLEVYSLNGVDAESKPRDPVYSAIVRDPSGYARLIYRSSNNCRPSNVKKGKFYMVSGARGVGQGAGGRGGGGGGGGLSEDLVWWGRHQGSAVVVGPMSCAGCMRCLLTLGFAHTECRGARAVVSLTPPF